MLSRIEDIKKALQAEAYLSALALALTIPDICGKLQNPTARVGARYRQWYEENLPELHTHFFSSHNCYKLRCAFLHEGRNPDASELESIAEFTLCYGKYIRYGESTFLGELVCRSIQVDIPQLCNAMCNAARAFYEKYHDQYNFNFLNIIL